MNGIMAYLPLLLTVLVLLVIIVQLYSLARLSRFTGIDSRLYSLERQLERIERVIRDESASGRDESQRAARQGREESAQAVALLVDSLLKRMGELAILQKDQLEVFSGRLQGLTDSTEARLDRLRETVEERLRLVQEDTARKLELMRATVDEKLHDTLEKRLGDSFRLVSERLELVQRGLGEMQSLASGVGDLKRVLANVKTRGTFGEVQLASLLEQVLARGQYDVNVETRRGSGQRVEFALRLPGRDGVADSCVWLPIDAKFPQEDYLRLVEAGEQGDTAAVAESSRQLDRAVRLMAAAIRDKYLDPPRTTDFGVMFLPTEGLFAEVVRRPGLLEALQGEYKVMVAGPATLAAMLSSLQMGFRTLVIERRSAEVWNLLAAVRSEFARFGQVLEKTGKKLQEAGNHIDAAAVRTRSIEKKLKAVQDIPVDNASMLLGIDPWEDEVEG